MYTKIKIITSNITKFSIAQNWQKQRFLILCKAGKLPITSNTSLFIVKLVVNKILQMLKRWRIHFRGGSKVKRSEGSRTKAESLLIHRIWTVRKTRDTTAVHA